MKALNLNVRTLYACGAGESVVVEGWTGPCRRLGVQQQSKGVHPVQHAPLSAAYASRETLPLTQRFQWSNVRATLSSLGCPFRSLT